MNYKELIAATVGVINKNLPKGSISVGLKLASAAKSVISNPAWDTDFYVEVSVGPIIVFKDVAQGLESEADEIFESLCARVMVSMTGAGIFYNPAYILKAKQIEANKTVNN